MTVYCGIVPGDLGVVFPPYTIEWKHRVCCVSNCHGSNGRSAMIVGKHKAKKLQREGVAAATMYKQLLLERANSEPVTLPPGAAERLLLPTLRRLALVSVKAVHSLIYFSVEFCMGYLIYAGLKGREDRRTAITAGVVVGESIIFLGNRCRCPLTGLAEHLGAARGSVTDIYLPGFLAANLVWIHIPLLALVLCLHARNFLRRSRVGAPISISCSRVQPVRRNWFRNEAPVQ